MMTDLADDRPDCCSARSRLGRVSPPMARAPRRRNERRLRPSQYRCLPASRVNMDAPPGGGGAGRRGDVTILQSAGVAGNDNSVRLGFFQLLQRAGPIVLEQPEELEESKANRIIVP